MWLKLVDNNWKSYLIGSPWILACTCLYQSPPDRMAMAPVFWWITTLMMAVLRCWGWFQLEVTDGADWAPKGIRSAIVWASVFVGDWLMMMMTIYLTCMFAPSHRIGPYFRSSQSQCPCSMACHTEAHLQIGQDNKKKNCGRGSPAIKKNGKKRWHSTLSPFDNPPS